MSEISNTLSVGTKLDRYEIIQILGQGGFGITYLALDTTLNIKVAIKEYFPIEMGVRDAHSHTLHSISNRSEDYQFGLEKFLQEARVLAQFNHPNIVNVTNFLKLNNTAYLIMSFEAGEDLSTYLKRIKFKGKMPESEINFYMLPILNGLKTVHEKGLLHRDIKPANIYLRQNKEPLLIDFGAARYALGEQSKSMSAIISMGYAPPEQYSTRAKQSPATDLYAWAATTYQLITGKPPIESPDRSNAFFEGDPDPMTPVSHSHKGTYSSDFLKTIDQCLLISSKKRPQSAAEVLALISGNKITQKKIKKTVKVKSNERFQSSNKKKTIQKDIKSDSPRKLSTPSKSEQAPKKEQSSPLKKALVFLVVIFSLSGLFLGVDYYFDKKRQREDQALNDFLNTRQQQRQKLEKHKQDNSFQEMKLLTIAVQKGLNKLKYQVKENGILDQTTIDKIKQFETSQNLNPTGKPSQFLIDTLSQAYVKADEQAWKQALLTKTEDAFKNYQQSFPNGSHINEAIALRAQLKIEQAQQTTLTNQPNDGLILKSKKNKDLADWEIASDLNNLAGYNNYLQKHSTGKFSKQAKQRITLIQNNAEIEKQNAINLTLQLAEQQKQRDIEKQKQQAIIRQQKQEQQNKRDEAAWENVFNQFTLANINKYKADFPNGNHIAEVPAALKKRKKELYYIELGIKAFQKEHQLKLNKLRVGDKFSECTQCPQMVVIPAGTFKMGRDNGHPLEGPQHKVSIKKFMVSTTEVTFNQWNQCVIDKWCKHQPSDEGWGRGNRPVINVSWNDTKNYINWLNDKTYGKYRLLSESEWEYAAHGGMSKNFGWGDKVGKNKANCKKCGSQWDNVSTSPVKSFKANKYGLYDMHGNVIEWVQDCYHPNHDGAPSDGSARLTGSCSDRIYKGGNYTSLPYYMWALFRNGTDVKYRSKEFGFRIASDL